MWAPHRDYAGEWMADGQWCDPPRTAAWLCHNPSRASHLVDDPTAGRIVHHSDRAMCPRSLVGNIWPLRTPYPAELRALLPGGKGHAAIAGTYASMMSANLDALTMISAQADIHIVAFGAAPLRDHLVETMHALEAFSCARQHPLYCFGTTYDGLPLHPLARGKLAVRNDAVLQPWEWWEQRKGRLSWDEVFSDMRRTPSGWASE